MIGEKPAGGSSGGPSRPYYGGDVVEVFGGPARDRAGAVRIAYAAASVVGVGPRVRAAGRRRTGRILTRACDGDGVHASKQAASRGPRPRLPHAPDTRSVAAARWFAVVYVVT